MASELENAIVHTDLINARLRAARVLIVDDSSVTRRMLLHILSRVGVYNTYEARDAASGLKALRDIAPDAVILDWEMPDSSGGQFLRTVRSPDTFPYPDTPIIVVSGHSEQKVVTEAFCAGVNEFLIKPVSPNSLRDRLVQVLVYPRKTVQVGAYYGPKPRRTAALLPGQSRKPIRQEVWLDS